MSTRRRAWHAWRLVYLEEDRSRNDLARSQYARWKLLSAWRGFVLHVQRRASKRARLQEASVHCYQSYTRHTWRAWQVLPLLAVAMLLFRSEHSELLQPFPESYLFCHDPAVLTPPDSTSC